MSEILKGDQQEQSQMALTKICELAAPPPAKKEILEVPMLSDMIYCTGP